MEADRPARRERLVHAVDPEPHLADLLEDAEEAGRARHRHADRDQSLQQQRRAEGGDDPHRLERAQEGHAVQQPMRDRPHQHGEEARGMAQHAQPRREGDQRFAAARLEARRHAAGEPFVQRDDRLREDHDQIERAERERRDDRAAVHVVAHVPPADRHVGEGRRHHRHEHEQQHDERIEDPVHRERRERRREADLRRLAREHVRARELARARGEHVVARHADRHRAPELVEGQPGGDRVEDHAPAHGAEREDQGAGHARREEPPHVRAAQIPQITAGSWPRNVQYNSPALSATPSAFRQPAFMCGYSTSARSSRSNSSCTASGDGALPALCHSCRSWAARWSAARPR